IWYRWTAPTSGPYSLAAFATAVDTLAAVYTGASVGSLSLVAANDNNAGGQNTDALVSFNATAGTTYYLQIDHTNDSSSPEGGDLTLTLTDSLWEFPAQDEITSSPAVADNGVVYVGSVDGRVYAINPDGSQKWQFPAANVTEVGDFDGASPAIGPDGTVYIGCLDNHLYALDGATGAKKWSYAGSTPSYSAPAIAADGTIYHRDQSKLYALTPAGTLKWSFELNPANVEGTYCSPVIGTDGTLYIGTSGGAFFALRDTGTSATVKWTFTADGDIYTSPAIAADGTLYFGTLAGKFYAITPGVSSAVQKWSLSLPKFNGLDNSISSSPALGGDGTIYFAAYDHKLYAVNPATGAIKWSYTLGDEVRASSPAVAADGTVFVGAYDGLLYAVGPDGVLRRTYPTALRIRSSPTIAGTRLYFGSADAKLHAFDLGQSLVSSPWPMFHRNPAHDGRATSGLTITAQPQSQSAGVGGSVTLTAAASGTVPPAYQWQRNGAPVSGATASTLTLSNLQPRDTGVYAAVITSGTSVTSAAAIVGVSSSVKVVGTGTELQPANITHPNGNVFDQVLLTGEAAAITAEHAAGQITRMSFIDVDEDIVQVEFSGPGTLSLVLDSPSANAASPVNYNQPGVSYMKGHAGIVITGATDQTNVSVFTVGRATAFDPTGRYNILLPPSATNDPAANGSPLFQGRAATAYDGVADVSFIAISSANGKFGGIRTSNAHYFASKGFTGIYAPGVAFQGPVFIGDIIAFDAAKPVLVLGSVTDARITGGDLLQTNGEPVQVSGLSQLKFTAGSDSHGRGLSAQPNRGVLQQDGANVTAQIVVNPAP
ncbi:MAG TPA: PQQ-binding-like beta-propeller repeat protein, partial [Opitutus sp.]|nr:PQQ-binding-like beta-propeller repeat protein [Opitutus sp.]